MIPLYLSHNCAITVAHVFVKTVIFSIYITNKYLKDFNVGRRKQLRRLKEHNNSTSRRPYEKGTIIVY